MVVLVEYLWSQRNRYEGIKEYHEIFSEACEKHNATLLGILKPLNDPWQWTHLIEADTMVTWQNIIDEIDDRCLNRRDNIMQNNIRVYTRCEYNPRPKNLNKMRFLNVELDVWEGLNVGIKEYFDAHVDMYKEFKGVWFMGQYAVWNDPFNWAHFYWYDTQKNWKEANDLCFRAMGRPERIRTLVGRTYELYTP